MASRNDQGVGGFEDEADAQGERRRALMKIAIQLLRTVLFNQIAMMQALYVLVRNCAGMGSGDASDALKIRLRRTEDNLKELK